MYDRSQANPSETLIIAKCFALDLLYAKIGWQYALTFACMVGNMALLQNEVRQIHTYHLETLKMPSL